MLKASYKLLFTTVWFLIPLVVLGDGSRHIGAILIGWAPSAVLTLA